MAKAEVQFAEAIFPMYHEVFSVIARHSLLDRNPLRGSLI